MFGCQINGIAQPLGNVIRFVWLPNLMALHNRLTVVNHRKRKEEEDEKKKKKGTYYMCVTGNVCVKDGCHFRFCVRLAPL